MPKKEGTETLSRFGLKGLHILPGAGQVPHRLLFRTRVRFLYGVLTFLPYVVSLSCQRNANCAIVIGGRCGHPVALAIEAWY